MKRRCGLIALFLLSLLNFNSQNHFFNSFRDSQTAFLFRRIKAPEEGRISWTPELFLQKLKDVAARLETTSSTAFHNDPEGVRVCAAFQNHQNVWGYANWEEAVKAAGLEHTVYRWTKDLFLEKLRAVATRLGTTSANPFNNDPEGSKVYRAFRTHKQEWKFGTWRDAVKAAGL